MSKRKSFRPKPNFFWSILSVAGVLFVIGLFGLITIHSQSFVDQLKEEFEIIVELNPKATDKQIEQLKKDLEAEPGVLKGSVVFTSKEDGLKSLSDELGEELLKIDMPNPLSDIVSFRMTGAEFDLKNLEKIKARFSKGRPEVLSVYYQEGVVEGIVSNLDRLSYIFLIATVLLGLLALMLIYNAIRLSIYANRFLIKNMELVGASWSFIRKPFLRKSIKHGLMSALVAIGALVLSYGIAAERLPQIAQYLRVESLLYLVSMLVVIGMLINLASTWIVVTRFLNMSTNELHL
jgi:cell division transport system permease protein